MINSHYTVSNLKLSMAEVIVLVNLSIILLNNSHDIAYHAQKFNQGQLFLICTLPDSKYMALLLTIQHATNNAWIWL